MTNGIDLATSSGVLCGPIAPITGAYARERRRRAQDPADAIADLHLVRTGVSKRDIGKNELAGVAATIFVPLRRH
jgi:hypothetical protein